MRTNEGRVTNDNNYVCEKEKHNELEALKEKQHNNIDECIIYAKSIFKADRR